ncbi:MAG: flagellin [Gammaproteobacteria bacterium]|nr:flagellin [Gammaproteobacteria bacterium]
MPQIINTNIMALNAQRNLNTSQSSLKTSLQRLSSGLRINSSKDDAAGMAISDRFTTQIRGLAQASRNANDGISLAQVAEAAFTEVQSILQRVRELAVQSVNATNSPRDRQALQAEVGQLTAELNRIAKQTTFNGQNIMDGTFGTALFQVGANVNEYIVATTSNFKTNQYGDYRLYGQGTSATQSNTRFAAAGTITISGSEGSASFTVAISSSAMDIANKVNLNRDKTGVEAYAITAAELNFGAANSGAYRITLREDKTTSAVTVGFSLDAGTGVEALSRAASSINAVQAKTGVIATVKADGSGITLNHFDGETVHIADTTFSNAGNISVIGIDETGTPNAAGIVLTAGGGAVTVELEGQVIFDSDASFTISSAITDDTLSGLAQASLLQKVSDIDVATVDAANLTISIADAALAQISSQRAKFGALQARFESTIRNLEASVENLSSARSRVMDADFAVETTTLTRAQILQQAGTAMLAQANSIPGNVLSLLG